MTNAVEVEGVTVPVDHYIDGRRVASETTFEVRSPIDWDNWKLADVANGGQAEVDGATVLRACFVNHRTTEDDVRAVPEVVADVASGT